MVGKNSEIWAAVDHYFEHAESAKDESLRLIRQAHESLGDGIILAAFAWVAERLEKEGEQSKQLAMMGVSDRMLNLRLFAIAESVINLLGDVVALQKEAGVFLIASIMATPDEDEQALMAYMLATRFVSTFDQWDQAKARVFLKTHLQAIEGTSCKMALAYALYVMDEKDPWEKLVYGNVFMQLNFVRAVEATFVEMFPKRRKEAKSVVCREIAVPGSTDFQIPVPDQWGIREFLAIDIASNGSQFKNYPNWRRKPKN